MAATSDLQQVVYSDELVELLTCTSADSCCEMLGPLRSQDTPTAAQHSLALGASLTCTDVTHMTGGRTRTPGRLHGTANLMPCI